MESDTLKIPFTELEVNWNDHLGEGGFSVVYSAEWNNRTVAVKRLQTNTAEKQDRVFKEAQVLVRLKHQNIVSLFGVTLNPNTNDTLLVLEYLDGGSLEDLVYKKVPVPRANVIQIALDVAEALLYVHDQGIIHRDIKSGNVLLYANGRRAKLADLGEARILTKNSKADTQVGTHGFTAPEVLHEEPYNTKADIYSFGALLHRMITNKGLPMLFKTKAAMIERMKSDIKEISFQNLIIKCCSLEPKNRPTIEECIKALKQLKDPAEEPQKLDTGRSVVKKILPAQTEEKNNFHFIPFEEILISKVIGEANYIRVYLGTWRGQKVAIKTNKKLQYTSYEGRTFREAAMLMRLRHKHIVSCLGVTRNPTTSEVSLVLEYLKHGTLADLLFKNAVEIHRKDVIQLALDIAKGLDYLHAHDIIHRNIKPTNIMLYNSRKHAKIGSLGTARFLNKNSMAVTVVGTYSFIAPEILAEEQYNSKVDGYSFGALLYTMHTKEMLPIAEEDRWQRISSRVQDQEFQDLIIHCCKTDPAQRPTMGECVQILKAMKQQKRN